MPTTPNPPKGQSPELQRWCEEITKAVRELQDVLRPGNNNSMPFTDFANLTDTRTLDADATTTDELADVLGTLIQVLKSTRIIK